MHTIRSGELGFSTPLGEILGQSEEEMNAEFADYAELGAKWIRTNFWWDLAQTSKDGGYDWTEIDRVVDAARAHGIEVLAEFNGTPDWVDDSFARAADRTAFRDYVEAAVDHFGDRVDYWEVWNEQNMTGIAPDDYADLLRAVYPVVKAADPDDLVITGGLAATPQTGGGLIGAVDYLNGMYAAGAGGHFDAVGFHPYSYPLLPSDPAPWNGWQMMEDGIRDAMVANGDADLRVWMTELGAPTSGGGNAISQAMQAQILEEAVSLASVEEWAGPIMWYSYQDRGGATDNVENWFGVVGPSGERKEAYETFTDLAAAIADRVALVDAFAVNVLLEGNDADNVVTGTDGNDRLIGGAGDDRFVFSAEMGWDTITDFARGDRIDLGAIDADVTKAGQQAFNFVGDAWLSRPGDLGAYVNSGGWTTVQGDTNGDGRFDFSIRVDGGISLGATDFVNVVGGYTPSDPSLPRDVVRTGNAADNVVRGTAGNDALTGGGGNDRFVFTEQMGWDTITDFSEGDVIDLGAIDADRTGGGNQAFTFVGDAWLDAPGDLGFYRDSGGWTSVQGDTDGDGLYDFSIRVEGLHVFEAGDFVL